MPQIIINRPPRNGIGTARASDIGLNADVTIIEGGTEVKLQNASDVLVIVSGGETEIYTGQDAKDRTLQPE